MKLLTFVAALACAVLAAGAAEAKNLTFCSPASPEGFDPALFTAPSTFDVGQAIYDRLVEFEPGTTNLVPGLAERWEISPDGLRYTFHLRQGVSFHSNAGFTPSRPLDSDDVIFSFERQMKKDNPFFGYGGGVWGYFAAMSMPNLISSIERVDETTVAFVLARPEAAFLADVAMDFASILSKEYADQLKAADTLALLNQQPIGTGPFQFIAYDQGAVVRLKANPAYWGAKPKLDDLTFKITPDPAERIKQLKSGDCQVMADPDPQDIEALKKETGLTVMQIENPDIAYLAYNTTQKPFDDPRVRKALNMAINKQAIVDAVYGGDAKVAKSPIPPTLWSYNTALADDTYDPDGARKLLEEAGAKDLQMKIWAMPASRPYNPDAAKTAEMIKADFAKIGVTVTEIVSPDVGEYLRTSAAKDRDGAVLLGWTGDNADPDNFLSVLLGCDGVGISNRAQWCAPPFQDLVVKAKVITDQTERAKLYEEAQTIFKDQAPWATLAHSLATVAMSSKVTGYKMDPLGRHRFDTVDLAE